VTVSKLGGMSGEHEVLTVLDHLAVVVRHSCQHGRGTDCAHKDDTRDHTRLSTWNSLAQCRLVPAPACCYLHASKKSTSSVADCRAVVGSLHAELMQRSVTHRQSFQHHSTSFSALTLLAGRASGL